MIVLFDLDNTLIDTQLIKQKIFYETAIEYGFTNEDAKNIYKSIRNVEGKVILCPKNFALVLAKKVVESQEQILQKMYTKLKEMGKNLCIDGAVEILENVCLSNLVQDMYIMTLGVHSWQEEKIEYTGLGGFFPREKRILPALDLSEKDAKGVALKNFFGKRIVEEKSVLFNDKPTETAELLRRYPLMQGFVRRDGRDERYTLEDFRKYAEEFGGRFIFSESLFELKNKFEIFLSEEYGQK